MKDLGDAKYLICIQIERRTTGIWMGQPQYTQDFLKGAQMWADELGEPMNSKSSPMSSSCKHDENAEPLNASRHSSFRSNLMKASYLAQQTRPDIINAVNI